MSITFKTNPVQLRFPENFDVLLYKFTLTEAFGTLPLTKQKKPKWNLGSLVAIIIM